MGRAWSAFHQLFKCSPVGNIFPRPIFQNAVSKYNSLRFPPLFFIGPRSLSTRSSNKFIGSDFWERARAKRNTEELRKVYLLSYENVNKNCNFWNFFKLSDPFRLLLLPHLVYASFEQLPQQKLWPFSSCLCVLFIGHDCTKGAGTIIKNKWDTKTMKGTKQRGFFFFFLSHYKMWEIAAHTILWTLEIRITRCNRWWCIFFVFLAGPYGKIFSNFLFPMDKKNANCSSLDFLHLGASSDLF